MVFIMFFLEGTILYGLAYFLPPIINQLGFSPNKTQLLSVGPFALALVGELFFLMAQLIKTQAACFFSYFIFCILVRPL